MNFQIRTIAADQTWLIRQQVLRPHHTLDKVKYPVDDSASSFHLGAFDSDQNLIAVASFQLEVHPDFKVKKKSYRLRGMATTPQARGQGAGKALLLKAFDELKARHCDFLWCNAREVAFAFYEKLDFQYHGEFFEIEDIGPHKVMYKHLLPG